MSADERIRIEIVQRPGYDAHRDCTDPTSPIVHFEGGWCATVYLDGRLEASSPSDLGSREAAVAEGERSAKHVRAMYGLDGPPKMNAYERMMADARPGEHGGDIVDEGAVETGPT